MRHKNSETGLIFSKPTMCLRCHLIVEMFHEGNTDPVKGAWQCPKCGHKYPFSHWKIRKQSQKEKEGRTPYSSSVPKNPTKE